MGREELEYTLYRRRFLQSMQTTKGKGDLNHFDFSEYLSIVLGNQTAHMVHIPPKAWLMVELAFIGCYLVMVADTEYRMRAYVLGLCVVFVGMLMVLSKLYRIRDALLPKLPAWWQSDENGGKAFLVGDMFWSFLDIPAAEPPFLKQNAGGKGDQQSRLFWGGNLPHWVLGHHPGPELVSYIARFCNLLCIIWACLLLYAAPYTRDNDKAFKGVVAIAFLVNFAVMWFWTPEMLRLLTMVESVELMKKPGFIDRTITQMKTKRTMKTMVLLRAMCRVVRQNKALAGTESTPATNSSPAKTAAVADQKKAQSKEVSSSRSKRWSLRKQGTRQDGYVAGDAEEEKMAFAKVYHTLDDAERKRCDKLKEFFNMFDKSGDGTIDSSELGGLLRSFGLEFGENDLKRLMQEFDKSGDGVVSFPEFYSYMKSRIEAKEEDTLEMVKDIFSIMDANGDEKVSVEEFSTVLKSLPMEMSDDDIQSIVNDMDVNGDGEISCHEFADLLDQHKQ